MSKFIVIQKSEKFSDLVHTIVNKYEAGWGHNAMTKAYADLGMGYKDTIDAQHAAAKLLWQGGHLVPMALVEAPALRFVFGIAQNKTQDGWLRDARVVPLTAQGGTYSMSVGDMILEVETGSFFVLASVGMNEIDLGGGVR